MANAIPAIARIPAAIPPTTAPVDTLVPESEELPPVPEGEGLDVREVDVDRVNEVVDRVDGVTLVWTVVEVVVEGVGGGVLEVDVEVEVEVEEEVVDGGVVELGGATETVGVVEGGLSLVEGVGSFVLLVLVVVMRPPVESSGKPLNA
jgi:hypothetical protein